MGKHWPYLAPEEHKYQFTRASLEKVFQDAGFKVLCFESRSGLFEYASPLGELWNAATSLKKRVFTDIVTFPWSFLVTSLKSGDSMSMIAIKS